METLTDRITRYLLKRLRRHAVLTLYEQAAGTRLLTAAFIGRGAQSGRVWTVTEHARHVLTGNPRQDRKIVERLMRANRALQDSNTEPGTSTASGNASDDPLAFDRLTEPASDGQHKATRRNVRAVKAAVGSGTGADIDFPYLASLLREHLPRPSAVHAAVALLVARAVGTSLSNTGSLSEVLRATAPFVLLKAPVKRFELCLATMLEDGLVLPFGMVLEDVLRSSPLSGRYPHQHAVPGKRRLKTLSGIAVDSEDDSIVRRQLRHALSEPAPIVLVDETVGALTPVVTETADYVLECTGFDRAMIAELLHVCAGTPPKESLVLMDDRVFEPDGLTLDDIALAVRPRRSAQATLSILAMLAGHSAKHEEGDEKDDQNASGRKQRSGKRRAGETKRSQGAGVEVIEPVAVADGDASVDTTAETPASEDRLLSVEGLAGYGPARDWALDLKADLSLWRNGELRWDEMSTKLLLSGPPGTGKTTFARALCNTLQVPLLVTSVANWLEPGFLGDVLKRMSAAFAFAAQNAPAILFIDELDNIGKRQAAGSRSHDDYWISLINRMLELLDGASKSEGVIVVGATNFPEKIDPALLRSGRLETHIRIPMPDMKTLIGILGHHLGSDLEAVLASAPGTTTVRRLRPPPARDGKPLLRRKPSFKPQADKGPRHD
ncbi:ATP-binding protein [Shinella sp. CPCC 100929]|uniref:ATP-binding protein n=1 Tax=Shinella lacus TaxID=2654216 RepID=A0ABT1RIG1_9HYPH|nr:ATP-binding protein [Shinella lacus]MCQ4634909.1 ATP-binding protein [Shinella lacus]